ncbi:MAG: hypothetical protein KKA29_14510, partial [Gammaproteobacteria bacterium]|nr:hypothetical protein [Gammaproteobacteria bacterium]
ILGNVDLGIFHKFTLSGSGLVSFTGNNVIEWVNPEWWGAAGDNTTNDTDAINAALVTAKNVKLTSLTGYYIDDALVFSATRGQILSGVGHQQAKLTIDASFDTTEDGVIELGANRQAVENLRVICDQVDTATRGSMTAFPPIIYAAGRTYTRFENLRFVAAYDGIDVSGAVESVTIDNIQMSFFNHGITMNGASENVNISRLKFGEVETLTANQKTLLHSDDTYGLYITQGNGISISHSWFNVGTAIDFVTGSTIRASIKGCTFLNENAILMASGVVSVSTSDFIGDGTTEQIIQQSAGRLTISSSTFDINADMTNPMIDVTGGQVILNGCVIDTATHDMTAVYGTGLGTKVILTGNHFIKGASTAYSEPTINVVSLAILTATNNTVTPIVTSTGDMIAVDSDSTHIITNNNFSGYDIDLPTTPENMQVSGNVVLAASSIDQENIVGTIKYRIYTGTLGADGTLTRAHTITGPADKIIGWEGLYRTAANTAGMMNAGEITVDGTNINVAGTAAALDSAKYRITLMISSFYDDWS